MKSILTSLTLLVFSFCSAQNSVVFQVDMSLYTGSYSQVNLNGSFNGWCGECAVMTDDDSDLIYEITVDLPSGVHEYKFTVDGWTDDEIFTPGSPCTMTTGDFTNRVVDISGDTTLDVVCWESCGPCGTVTSADVTFRVDMNEYTGPYTTVNLNGTFNNWCGGCAVMTDDDSDGIYEITVNVLTGIIEYKFTVDGWTDDETLMDGMPCTLTTDDFTNRFLDVSEDVTLDPVCWESCVACGASSLGEFTNSVFSVFPNPSNGLLRISTEHSLDYIAVFDMNGSRVLAPEQSLNGSYVDLSTLQNGVYFLEMGNEEVIGVEMIVIE